MLCLNSSNEFSRVYTSSNNYTCRFPSGNPFFMSWVASEPEYHYNSTASGGTVPFAEISALDRYKDYYGLPDPLAIGTDPTQPQALFFAYRRHMVVPDATVDVPPSLLGQPDPNLREMMLLNCSLWNSTYVVTSRNDGQQHIRTDHMQPRNNVTVVPLYGAASWPAGLHDNTPEVKSYLAIMQVLGDLLVGSLWWDGSLYKTDRTRVFETNLAFTEELFPAYAMYTNSSVPLQGLRPLATVMEELFQNITLSLLSVPNLLAPQSTNTTVTVTSTHNVYRYDAMRLWTAYGAALAAALLAAVIGLTSLVKAGASYSNRFSTVVRVSRDQSLAFTIDHQDRGGQDPLPDYIGKARFSVEDVQAGRKAKGADSGQPSELQSLRSMEYESSGYLLMDGTVRTRVVEDG